MDFNMRALRLDKLQKGGYSFLRLPCPGCSVFALFLFTLSTKLCKLLGALSRLALRVPTTPSCSLRSSRWRFWRSSSNAPMALVFLKLNMNVRYKDQKGGGLEPTEGSWGRERTGDPRIGP